MSTFQNFLGEQAPLEPRAFGARLPRRLLFQYSLLLKNLLKALPEIQAIPQNNDVNHNHRSVRVAMPDGSIRQCRGGIDIDHLLGFFRVELPKYFSSSFLSSLSPEYTQVNFSNIQESFQNLRYKLHNCIMG